jgi:2-phosphoglycerate kinase
MKPKRSQKRNVKKMNPSPAEADEPVAPITAKEVGELQTDLSVLALRSPAGSAERKKLIRLHDRVAETLQRVTERNFMKHLAKLRELRIALEAAAKAAKQALKDLQKVAATIERVAEVIKVATKLAGLAGL